MPIRRRCKCYNQPPGAKAQRRGGRADTEELDSGPSGVDRAGRPGASRKDKAVSRSRSKLCAVSAWASDFASTHGKLAMATRQAAIGALKNTGASSKPSLGHCGLPGRKTAQVRHTAGRLPFEAPRSSDFVTRSHQVLATNLPRSWQLF
jgi:hypothetical protein